MDESTKALLVLAGVIGLFVWNRLPVTTVALLAALTLWLTGLVTTEQALAGFGDPVVVFIATLFVVSEGIDSNGVTTWAGQALLGAAGTDRTRVLVAISVLAAVMASFITLNGAAAALLPLVVLLAARIKVPASQLLMPMAFAGSAGGLLMLMSSPVNVIVSDASTDAGAGGFAFFSFALVGIPLLVGTVAICVLLGPRLLPHTNPDHAPPDLGRYAEILEGHYQLTDGFYRLRIRSRSKLIGADIDQTDFTDHPGLVLIGVEAADGSPVLGTFHDDDVLVVTGPAKTVTQFSLDHGLAVAMIGSSDSRDLLTREAGVAEVIVPPRSDLVGEKVYPGMQRQHELVILAVQRLGKDLGPKPVELVEGDALLLHGRWSALDQLNRDRDVLLVDSPGVVRRQAVPWGAKATRSVIILAGLVAMLASGQVPPAMAGLIAAVAMVLFDVVSAPQAYRSVSWQTVVLVGGLIPLSTAIQSSGAADKISDLIIDVVGNGQPYLLMVAMFALTAALGQVISNTATVLVVTPIAIAAAQGSGVSVQPMLMLVAVAGCAALLTPISTPANIMIMAPGGYRFGDYWKLGAVVMVWWFAVAMVIIPLVWAF